MECKINRYLAGTPQNTQIKDTQGLTEWDAFDLNQLTEEELKHEQNRLYWLHMYGIEIGDIDNE